MRYSNSGAHWKSIFLHISETESLVKDETDVIVIGAGIAGAGVAAELSADHRVVLLEQEDHPGIHATGRSAALHSEIYGNACIRALTRASRDFFLLGEERPFATPRGCIHPAAAHQLDELERLAQEPSVAGAARRISGEEARGLVPVLRPGYIVEALAEAHAYDSRGGYFVRRARLDRARW